MTGDQASPLAEGVQMRGGARTVTDAEVALLPAIMGAINPLFHDEEASRATAMKGRILYGPAVLGIAVALTEHLLREHVIGLIEISTAKFRAPVRVGDTITATFTVRSCVGREGRAGHVLTLDDAVTNQRSETVMTFSRRILIHSPRVES